MAYRVEVSEAITQPSEWAGLAAASGAPIFYEPAFLNAYERHPLQPVERFFYIVVREDPGHRAVAVSPVTLQPWNDPVGALRNSMEIGNPPPRLLLSHVWHCYDTQLVATHLTRGIVEAVCDCLSTIARRERVGIFGFVDVDGSGPFLQWLADLGFSQAHIFNRHLIDLRGLNDFDGYLATVGVDYRHNLRRHHRRALEAGAELSVRNSNDSALSDVVGLCQSSAAKHGSSSYYPRDELIGLCRELGDRIRLLTVHLRGRLIAGSICMLDERRFHQWAGGADYSTGERFSPYYELHHLAIETALASHRQRFEGGRGNDDFKRHHGMRAIPLYACLTQL